MDVLVTYDISTLDVAGERRLREVAHACERYGVRVQYSVFECRLNAASLQRLTNELLSVIDHRMDSVHIFRFAGDLNDAKISLGRKGALRVEAWGPVNSVALP